MADACWDDPSTILKTPICLAAISKNLTGQMRTLRRSPHRCERPGCITVKVQATLLLATVLKPRSKCDDRELAKALDGKIAVKSFVCAYQVPPGGSPQDPDGSHRGLHSGDFQWSVNGAVIVGRMSGISNAGTHRPPAFGECQVCNQPNVMEGRLCGTVRAPAGHVLEGCRVQAAYRLALTERSYLKGVLEGVVIRPCSAG